jgi:ankyrin repeat protein
MAKAIGLFTDNLDELKTWYETSGKNKPIQDLFPGFVYAVENQNIETAKFFIVNGVDVNQVYAINESIVDRSDFDMLTLLFDSGLQIDFQSDFGKELLANKAAVADIDSARLLIQHGADVNAYTECGGTALLEACFMTFKAKHMKMIQFLLENGANPNICYSSSSLGSPLHRVCQKGSLEAVKLLVEYGADLNYKETRNDRHGYYKDSALLAAAKENHLDIVKYLIEHGADVHILDGFGFSLLDVSKSPEMREYVKTVFIVEPLTYAFPDVTVF